MLKASCFLFYVYNYNEKVLFRFIFLLWQNRAPWVPPPHFSGSGVEAARGRLSLCLGTELVQSLPVAQAIFFLCVFAG